MHFHQIISIEAFKACCIKIFLFLRYLCHSSLNVAFHVFSSSLYFVKRVYFSHGAFIVDKLQFTDHSPGITYFMVSIASIYLFSDCHKPAVLREHGG